jgi:hypothetical protein
MLQSLLFSIGDKLRAREKVLVASETLDDDLVGERLLKVVRVEKHSDAHEHKQHK